MQQQAQAQIAKVKQREAEHKRLSKQLANAGEKLPALASFLSGCQANADGACTAAMRDEVKSRIAAVKHRKKLEQNLASAGDDRGALKKFLDQCYSDTNCGADFRAKARVRLAAAKQRAEENAFAEQLSRAGDDKDALEQFLSNCRANTDGACNAELQDKAQARIAKIKQAEHQQFVDGLENAGEDEAALESFLASCRSSSACTDDLKSQAQTRLEAAKREKQRQDEQDTYTSARGDIDKLRTYVATCTYCEYKDAAESEISKLLTRWHAVASGIWNTFSGAHVTIGYSGTRSSASEARLWAISACEASGGRNCRIVAGPFDFGCLYITWGNSLLGVRWGTGATRSAAIRICQKGGYSCRTPIGGCVQ